MATGNKPQLLPPKPKPFFYLKSGIYYERIEGGTNLPKRVFLNRSKTLECELVLLNSAAKVITGLRQCDVGKHLYLGDKIGANGGKSFLWLQAGKDLETGGDCFKLWIYPDWMPSDGCEFLRKRKKAANQKMAVQLSLDALDVDGEK